MFLNYSALFIQKSYKGYTVRKRWLPLINARLQAKSAILSLAKGWKTRKIFKSKELKNIQISVRDMIKLVSEDPVDKTNPLLVKVRQQIPGLKQKFVQEFYKLYRKGSWVHYLPKAQSPKQDRSGILQKQDSSV